MGAHALAVRQRVPRQCPSHGAFRRLLNEPDWQRLPPAVQRRFDRELSPGESAVYTGEVAETRLTLGGWLWAQATRLMGAPLPLKTLARTAATVVVTADAQGDAQLWTRIYHEDGRLPQVIRSMKSFSGPTGLEERVGAGLSMALVVSVEQRALVFRSAGYYWHAGRWTWRMPRWMTPGDVEVRHREERHGRFSFALSVVHPWFGRIIHQVAFFRDAC